MSQSKILYQLIQKTLRTYRNPVTKACLNDLPAVDSLKEQPVTPTASPPTPILNHIGAACQETQPLVNEVICSAATCEWRQPYTPEEVGQEFVQGSAWLPIADSNGPLVLDRGLVEIMLFDANINYPRHSHAAEELYLVLAGKFWWEAPDDDESPAWLQAGQLIHHPPHRAHALTAGDEPALLLAVWRGSGFQKPVFI